MGLMDKIKGILFDEEPDDTEEVLPKRESKKKKFKKDNYVDAEDTITEVKVTDNEDRFNFDDTEEYKTISRAKLREDSYTSDEEEIEEHKEKTPIEPLQVDKIIERSHSFERPVIPERKEEEIKKEDRSRYELPPKKEVVHETRDYSKFINEAKNGIKRPFVVTPIISPVYGILDKNYKPEEIAEKNKPEKIEQVRERMFGPVSYQGEEIPEPTRYEETKETLTETLIKENKEKEKKKEEEKAHVESEFDTAEYEEIKEKPIKSIISDDYEDETPVKPSVDIESLLNDEPEISFDNKFDDEEDGIIKSDDKYFEDEEEPSKFEDDEQPVVETKTRKEEPKESLDDTIETDLFNLIDSMYNSDERE